MTQELFIAIGFQIVLDMLILLTFFNQGKMIEASHDMTILVGDSLMEHLAKNVKTKKNAKKKGGKRGRPRKTNITNN